MPETVTTSPRPGQAVADPELPGLGVVLDGAALGAWLSEEIGHHVRAAPRYVRYKPGTSCVAAVELEGPGSDEVVMVSCWSRSSGPKLAKSLRFAPAGATVAVDPDRLLAVTTTAADRELPAMRLLDDAGARRSLVASMWPTLAHSRTLETTTLSYKPRRRWVGRLDADDGRFVLRAFRRSHTSRAISALDRLGRHAPTPRLLAVDRRSGLALVEHLDGRPLDPTASPKAAGRAGEAVARLHRQDASPGVVDAGSDLTTAHRSAVQAGHLDPELGQRLRHVVDRLSDRVDALEQGPRAACLHGDLSWDQMVERPGGDVGLIDLDRACSGPVARDLGNLIAASISSTTRAAPALATFLDAYAASGRLPGGAAVRAHTTLHLVRRAPEPFRLCRPEWRDDMRRTVELAERSLAGEVLW